MVKHKAVIAIRGPLLFVKEVRKARLGDLVKVENGKDVRTAQVLEIKEDIAVLQVFEGTAGLSLESQIAFTGEPVKIPLSIEILGRIFNGVGRPIDGGPPSKGETYREVAGEVMNPVARDYPHEFIETGISAIDGLLSLVRGQKLPIFSGGGLPHVELAAQIARQSRVLGTGESFGIVFAAVGVNQEDANFFATSFRQAGVMDRTVMYVNQASDPVIERLLTPRLALTTAEYLAFEHGYHILTIIIDVTNYCEALREVSMAREEVPGRRGYPGYMYTDLASIYERAGMLKDRKGSITLIPILTMPDYDITHPIPDLTGYITEGQILLSQSLHSRGIYPPVDVLPSLSRLMKDGVGEGRTRSDHMS
ncbi:MAG: V-type ATP synthase subunit B, partial [Nitrososphaerota archaeon]